MHPGKNEHIPDVFRWFYVNFKAPGPYGPSPLGVKHLALCTGGYTFAYVFAMLAGSPSTIMESAMAGRQPLWRRLKATSSKQQYL